MSEEAQGGGGAGLFGRIRARFGEIARILGIVHEHDVNEALEHQETTVPRKKLGEILVEKGKMTDDHVEAVLKEQQSPSVKAEAAALAAEAPAPEKPAAETPSAGKPTVKKAPAKKPAAKKAVKKAAKKAKRKPEKKSQKKAGGK